MQTSSVWTDEQKTSRDMPPYLRENKTDHAQSLRGRQKLHKTYARAISKQKRRQTDRQTDRQTERRTERRTDPDRSRQRQTETDGDRQRQA